MKRARCHPEAAMTDATLTFLSAALAAELSSRGGCASRSTKQDGGGVKQHGRCGSGKASYGPACHKRTRNGLELVGGVQDFVI